MKTIFKHSLSAALSIGAAFLILIILSSYQSIDSEESTATQPPLQNKVRVAFWNVENLFDAHDDPSRHDLVPGIRDVQKKILALSQTIASLPEQIPDIIGFAEVENFEILSKLAESIDGTEYPTRVLWEGSDKRGIDTALISRFPLISSSGIPISKGSRLMTRATLDIYGTPLTIYVVHNRSRRGGIKKSSTIRIKQTKKIRDHIIKERYKYKEFILLGDFNDNPNDKSITENINKSLEVTQTAPQSEQDPSYFYRKKPQYYDQIFISCTLIHKSINRYPCHDIDLKKNTIPWKWNENRKQHVHMKKEDFPSDHGIIWVDLSRDS